MSNKNSVANRIESSKSDLLTRILKLADMLSVAREMIREILTSDESERIEINLEPIIEELETIRADINAFSNQTSGRIRSVVGTIEIAQSDPDLSRADEYIRKVFSQSLSQDVTRKKTKRVIKPKIEKDNKVGRHKRVSH